MLKYASVRFRVNMFAFAVLGLLLASLFAPPLAARQSIARTGIAPNVPTLAFDGEIKSYDASPGEMSAPFTFNLTNVWTNEIVITNVKASCHCTVASMPSEPWHLAPQASGQVKARIDLQGKMGSITKTLTFFTSVGTRIVYLKVNVPPPPSLSGKMTDAERMAARLKATADAQAIFKGDCASCHADKGRNAYGQDLYALDCGICHESSHRDSKVPDLHALKQPTDFDYWKTIITFGKAHTMMPAFAASQGGPLTEPQIISLATYLNHTISHNVSPSTDKAASAANLHASDSP
jgi:mono/diheme cytochrome c family protein